MFQQLDVRGFSAVCVVGSCTAFVVARSSGDFSGEGGGLFLGWFCPASGSVSGWGLVFFSCTISVHVSVLSSGKFLLERAVSGD